MKPVILTDIEGTTSSISFVKGESVRLADALNGICRIGERRAMEGRAGLSMTTDVAPRMAAAKVSMSP